MIDKSRINIYLDDLSSQLDDLRKLPAPNTAYLEDPANFAQVKAIKYCLLVAIEDIIHIAAHLVAGLGLGRPSLSSASDLINILGKDKIIPANFAKDISGIINFRNRLAHEYLPAQLDVERLFQNIQKLDDFKKFAGYIVKFLESQD